MDSWNTVNQYKASGNIYYDEVSQITIGVNTYQTREFTYIIDTYEGQSGAPILHYSNGSYNIIGIHASGIYQPNGSAKEYIFNNGFGLTSEVFQFLVTYKNNS